MSDHLEYPDLVQEVRGALHPGKLKLQSSSVVFRNIKTGKVDHYQSTEIDKFQWLKRARGCCLKLTLENDTIQRYDGFKDMDFEKLSSFVTKNYHTSLEKVDLSVKGWNWGAVKFKGNSLNFEVDNLLAFEVPLSNVSHTTSLKNEVTVEFHQNDDAAVSLMELRFHIPGDTNEEENPVQEFYNNVVAKADIIQLTGDAIVTFSEVHCLTPRGRYDVKMFTSYIQLHGKTFDYKIPISSVLRLFLLPHKDGRQMFFVVSLDPPIKQGQTRYPFLILLFNKEDEITVDVTLSEEELEKKYEGKLSESMSGHEYEVISRVFKAIINRKITVPGTYVGRGGSQAISCSYKAATGFLYPLERGFIFVHKPPIHIRFDEVLAVNFARSAGSTRSFDFDVETKSGTLYTFVGIEKEEYGKLYDFVAQKKLRVKNIGGGLPKKGKDHDDDMFESDEEDTHDAYLVRMKAEGKEREEEEDDESDDSSDESFNPGESGSEVAEEYDSNPTTTADSDSDFDAGSGSESGSGKERKSKKKEKKEKKQRSKSAKTVREGKPRERRKKKDVDPDRPKRPQSAYFLWLNDNRENIKEANPGISITEISKKAGEMWKLVTDKTDWEKKAEEGKKEYQIAMEKYKEKVKERGDEQPSASPKKHRSPKSPKKVTDSRAGAGGDYKSKEFISSSDSSDEDKPLKKKAKKERKEKKAREDSEDDKLPEDEEILSTPPSSGKSDSESEDSDE